MISATSLNVFSPYQADMVVVTSRDTVPVNVRQGQFQNTSRYATSLSLRLSLSLTHTHGHTDITSHFAAYCINQMQECSLCLIRHASLSTFTLKPPHPPPSALSRTSLSLVSSLSLSLGPPSTYTLPLSSIKHCTAHWVTERSTVDQLLASPQQQR